VGARWIKSARTRGRVKGGLRPRSKQRGSKTNEKTRETVENSYRKQSKKSKNVREVLGQSKRKTSWTDGIRPAHWVGPIEAASSHNRRNLTSSMRALGRKNNKKRQKKRNKKELVLPRSRKGGFSWVQNENDCVYIQRSEKGQGE